MVNGPAVFRPVGPYRRVWRPVLTRFRRGVGTHPRDHGGSDTSNACPKKYTSQKTPHPKNTPPKKYTSQKIHRPKNTPPKKYASQKIHLPKNTPPKKYTSNVRTKIPPSKFPPGSDTRYHGPHDDIPRSSGRRPPALETHTGQAP